MAGDTGMKLVFLAGTLSFSNEWLQTKEINWRIPVATALAAAAISGLGNISPNGATSVGVMALVVAAATPLNGKSPIQQIGSFINPPAKAKSKTTTAKVV